MNKQTKKQNKKPQMLILMQKVHLSEHKYWFSTFLATKFNIMIANHD